MTGCLVLVGGLAGAGKTTLAKRFEADGAVRMCPDEWLDALGFDIHDTEGRAAVQQLQWELTQTLLRHGMTVVDESGMWHRAERDVRRTWARSNGVSVQLHFLDAPVDVLTERVEHRNSRLAKESQRIEPGLVAFWSDRIERPDSVELALFDPPTPPSRSADVPESS